MKALTIRQPYATLVMIGAKPYEFRTWSTKYRGPLAIHAGAEWHTLRDLQMQRSRVMLSAWFPLPLGFVLGTVDLVNCVRVADLPHESADPLRTHHCGVADLEMFALVLENPRPFDAAIAAKGLQGLWNWDGEL